MKKLYVGNLSYDCHDQELQELFSKYGTVLSANIIKDRWDDSSKGFGFVEMENDDEAESAIEALDGYEHQGRNLRVNEARPKTERRGGGGNFRNGGNTQGDQGRW